MIRARKYLVILSSFLIKACSINLILLGTYLEPLIIIIIMKLNFLPSPKQHLHPRPFHPRGVFRLSRIFSASGTYAFPFFLVQMHRTQSLRCVVLRSVLCTVSHERTNVSYTYYWRVRSFGDWCACIPACIPAMYTWRVVPG